MLGFLMCTLVNLWDSMVPSVPSISGGRRATSTNLAAGTHCPAAATTKVAEGVLRSWSCR